MVAAANEEGLDPRRSTAPTVAERRPGDLWILVACAAVLSVPLLIALISFRRPQWTPVLDLAMTELRVRDVGGRHTPLVGLPGRIGVLSEQGSHPGPLSFYALAPTYRLLGSSAWALQAATLVVHLVAMITALVMAQRRGGRMLVVSVAVVLAVLTSGFGGGVLTEPWNPYLPLLWWVVALLAVWAVLCDDVAMLPVAVLAGSFCAQTHVPYLGLSLGLGSLATVWAVARWWRVPEERWRTTRWIGAAAVLGLLLWVPPTIDQVRHEPGNYRQLIDHFRDPPEEQVGLSTGVSEAAEKLDVLFLARGNVTDPGGLVSNLPSSHPSSVRGAVLGGLWALSALAAVRVGPRALVRLHAVVAASLVLMVLAISRIFGLVWYYLTLWGWAVGMLASVATIWTAVSLVCSHPRWRHRLPRTEVALVALAVVGLAVTARFTAVAADSPHADATVAAELAAVIDDVVTGLAEGDGVAAGRGGRYVVTWVDAFHIGSQGYGLLSELEREGFDVGVDHGARVPATRHRVLPRDDATARVHLATGIHVERWRAIDSAVEIAHRDPRSATERAEQRALREEVVRSLRSLGLTDLLSAVDDNLFGAAIDPRVPDAVKERMGRMLEIGAPLSIFVLPPDAADP